eukprot:8111493-Alexandrium_andersonii.AAC.1
MHTLIKNVGVQWIDSEQRWLIPSECFVLQGYPIRPEWTNPRFPQAGDIVTSFASRVRSKDGRARKRTSAAGQAGNAMHCN